MKLLEAEPQVAPDGDVTVPEPPADATPIERLVAFTGRRPR